MYALARGTGLVSPTHRAVRPFRLHRPTSLAEALEAQAAEPGGAVWACGTTDLVAQLREGLKPAALISLRRVGELAEIMADGGDLLVGATTDHEDGAGHELTRRMLPGFAQGWSEVANPRIRLRASIGGNLMARRPRYELSTMLDALDATLVLRSGGSEVRIPPQRLWDDPPPPTLLLVRVVVEDTAAARFSYDRSLRPLLTLAVAARWRHGRLRLRAAVGSEYRRPASAELDLGAGPSPRDADEAASALGASLPEWIGDAAAGSGYRRAAVRVLLRRRLPGLLADAA